jgi:alpha-amylase
MTDRFATENGKKMPCNDLRSYCGGSFRGIAEKLDYISGLGMWMYTIFHKRIGYNTI